MGRPSDAWLALPAEERRKRLRELLPEIERAAMDRSQPQWWRDRERRAAEAIRQELRELGVPRP